MENFLLTSYIMETWFVWRIIPISPQVIPLYLHIRNEKLKVLSVGMPPPPPQLFVAGAYIKD
jgi:hypothetical protein